MAKIDVSKIEGYSEMTPEQKLAALEAYEIASPDMSGYVSKDVFDKKASETAALAKQLREKMSAEEQAEAARAAKEAEREARIAELESAAKLSEYKAKYTALGYDEKLAAETAKAFVEGNMDKVFEAQQKHTENVKKAERAAALANGGGGTPPPGSSESGAVTRDKFASMNYSERAELYNTDKELYQTLSEQGG